MKKFKKLMLIGMMALVLIGVQATSHALTIGFRDYNQPTTSIFYVDDNDISGLDINPLPGVITFSGQIGSWIVNVTTALSKDVIGSAETPQLDLNSLNVTSSQGGHLAFGMVDKNFTGNIGSNSWQFDVGGTTSGTAFFRAFLDPTNSGLFIGTVLAGLGPFSPTAFSGTATGGFVAGSPFALGIIADITAPPSVNTSFSSFDALLQVQQVPEPSVLLLVGVGLVGIWGFRKKVKK